MVYLNFTDLSKEAQERLLKSSKEDVKRKYGKDIIEYASLHNVNLDKMLNSSSFKKPQVLDVRLTSFYGVARYTWNSTYLEVAISIRAYRNKLL